MQFVTVEGDRGVLAITLNRPPVNAMTMQFYEEVSQAFETAGSDKSVRCIVLASACEKAFSAGLDLKEFIATSSADADQARSDVVARMFSAVENTPVPTIVAVDGPALGAACVLTSVCDIRIASRRASFGLPEINVGRCGGGAHFGRHVPPGVLRHMFFTAERMSAEDAFRLGYVQKLVANEELMDVTRETARLIAGKSPVALRLGKKALNECEGLPVEEGYRIEQSYSAQLYHSPDAKEAARAVLERREPVFLDP